MASIERIRVYPIKSLAGVDRDRARITDVGGLSGDRAYAIRDAAGDVVNGKRTADVHRIHAEFDLDGPAVTVGHEDDDEQHTFHLARERDALASWLESALGEEVAVVTATGGALTDSRVLGGGVAGATVVSTATLATVASWFPGVDVEGIRRRFRANLEVGGVPPFWEDRLVGADAPALRIGDVSARGVKPISRCVVPTREPDTGEATRGFRERFVERREATLPAWADPAAFDHFYALTTLVHPDEATVGRAVEVGDDVVELEGTAGPPRGELT